MIFEKISNKTGICDMENFDGIDDELGSSSSGIDKTCPDCGEHRSEFGSSGNGANFQMLVCRSCGCSTLLSDGEGDQEHFEKIRSLMLGK